MSGGTEEGEGGGKEGESWDGSPGQPAVVTQGTVEEGKVEEERVGGGREGGELGGGEVGEKGEQVEEI